MRPIRGMAGVLLAIAMLAASGSARAQVPGGATDVSGNVSVRGSYTASVTAAAGNTLPPNENYQADVAFVSTSTITSLDPSTQSGTFTSSGSYAAQISASGVPNFDATGTYVATGSFAAGRYTVNGSAKIAAPDAGSVTFNGTGTYNLGTFAVTASGVYAGDLQTAEFGAARVNGNYDGSAVVILKPQAINAQIALPTSLLGGMGTTAMSGPIAAVMLARRAPMPAPSGAFVEPPAFGPGGQSLAVFMGGTTGELEAAAVAAGASGVWAQDAVGQYQLLIVGGPAFANAAFRSAFPRGFTTATGVTLTR